MRIMVQVPLINFTFLNQLLPHAGSNQNRKVYYCESERKKARTGLLPDRAFPKTEYERQLCRACGNSQAARQIQYESPEPVGQDF